MKKTVYVVVAVFVFFFLIIATKTEAQPGDILYQDYLSDPKSGWPQGENKKIGKLAYENGKYLVRTNKAWPSMVQGSTKRKFTHFNLSVTTEQVLAPADNNNSYGVLCRYQEKTVKQNFGTYAFLISGDGFWSILKWADKKIVPLFYWTSSLAIRQGNAVNQLQVTCNGSYLSLTVNGQVLGEIHDQRLNIGKIALVAISYEDKPTEIHFDNLVIRSVY